MKNKFWKIKCTNYILRKLKNNKEEKAEEECEKEKIKKKVTLVEFEEKW